MFSQKNRKINLRRSAPFSQSMSHIVNQAKGFIKRRFTFKKVSGPARLLFHHCGGDYEIPRDFVQEGDILSSC